MTREEKKKALTEAVKDLYERQKVENDNDIAEATGYKKSAISLYVNGTALPSDKFLRRFEEVYKLKLQDFYKQDEATGIPSPGQYYTDDYIKLLKAQNDDLSKRVKILEENFLVSLTTLARDVKSAVAQSEAYQEQILELVTKDRKHFLQALNAAHNVASDKESAQNRKGNHVVANNGNT